MRRTQFSVVLSCWVLSVVTLVGTARAADPPPRTVTRVFFQDDSERVVKWADLGLQGSTLSLTQIGSVEGFPKLDADEQRLVQMEAARGFLLVGVRDEDDGEFGSGWILIDTGVEEEEHGDHSHWTYVRPPRVRALTIDKQQGNPAHLYCYDDVFYLANDRKNGYTRLDPAAITADDEEAAIRRRAVFHAGGGGHITLAASKRWGYSTWIGRSNDKEGGGQGGRVDITPLAAPGQASPPQIGLSITLPHGGLHGATFCQGKVFFAPSDGVCWIAEPAALPSTADEIPTHHLSLGQHNDKPRRTGAFQTAGKHVMFVTGAGTDAAFGLLDASAAEPEVTRVELGMAEENRPAGLQIVQPRRGSPLALVFHDHPAEVTAPNVMTLLELDPNEDGRWTDVRVAGTLDVGRSKVDGHNGHHTVDFDADRRRGVLSNPGDGTLSVFGVADRKILQTFEVGGSPSKVVTVGGRASLH